MVIDVIVQEFDFCEESIVILFCYLELYFFCWLEVLQFVKLICMVKFYGGYVQLREVVQKILLIVVVVLYISIMFVNFKKLGILIFLVVELVDKMGWDLVLVCCELRVFQWNILLLCEYFFLNMG